MRRPRKVDEILLSIYRNQGWDQDDLRVLSSLGVDDWVSLFKSVRGQDLSRIVHQAREFGRIRGEGERIYKKVCETATEALKRIGQESPINAMRVREIYGVDVRAAGGKTHSDLDG